MKKVLLMSLMSCLVWQAQANEAVLSSRLQACKGIPDATERLACFDGLLVEQPVKQRSAVMPVEGKANIKLTKSSSECEPPPPIDDKHGRYLSRKWHLSKECDEAEFLSLEPHRQNYIVVSMSSNPNDNAQTPSLPPTGERGLQNKDVQFQISLKTQLLSDLPFVRELPWVDTSRLWAAYTQRSYWQVFDGGKSEPFRETNFAPELILSLGLSDDRPRWLPRMVNLGALHESNGREEPYSRSWNRIYLEAGWQLGDQYTVIAKPWWAPSSDMDDNPDISRYLGYGDLTLRWDSVAHDKWAELLLRNNFRSDNKGYARVNFNYAISKHLSWYLMLSSGYGESLLDYNHHQNTIGLGFAVGD